MTLNQEARQTPWGPTVDQPKTVDEAIRYALNVIGDRERPASLGEIYALKGLQWALVMLDVDAQKANGG